MNRLWKGRFRWGRLLLVWLVFLLVVRLRSFCLVPPDA